MKRKLYIGIVVVMLALGVLVFFHHSLFMPGNDVVKAVAGKQILFYGRECPHCKVLEKWLIAKKIDKKIPLIKKEVFHNQTNLKNLIVLAKHCKFETNYLEVPFLWTGKRCIAGNKDIKQFFEGKLNEK